MTLSISTLPKLALGALLAAGLACTAIAQTTMRISISIGQNSHQGIGIDTFAKEVEKRTAGRSRYWRNAFNRWAAAYASTVFLAVRRQQCDG